VSKWLGEPVSDPSPPAKRYRDRVAASIEKAVGFSWNEVLGIAIIAGIIAATGIVDYTISKSANPDLPATMEANGTIGLVVIGVFLVVYKMYNVRLGRDKGGGDVDT